MTPLRTRAAGGCQEKRTLLPGVWGEMENDRGEPVGAGGRRIEVEIVNIHMYIHVRGRERERLDSRECIGL